MPHKNELETALARMTSLERELAEVREQRPAKALQLRTRLKGPFKEIK